MSSSSFCGEQRQKQEINSQKLLMAGLFSSLVLHSALAAVWVIETKPNLAEAPIELIIVEKPETPQQKETPKPKIKPSPVKKVKPSPQPKTQKSPTVAKPVPSVTNPQPVAEKKPIAEKIAASPAQPQLSLENPKPPEPETITPVAPSQPLTPSSSPTTLNPSSSKKPIFNNPSASEPIANESNPELPTSLVSEPSVSSSRPPVLQGSSQPLANNSQHREGLRNNLNNTQASAPSIRSNPELPTSLVSEPSVSSSRPPVFQGSSQPLANNSQHREGLRNNLNNTQASAPSVRADSNASAIATNPVASNRAAPKPTPTPVAQPGLQCISQCQPSYPSVLQGAEGKATVQVIVDQRGNVVSVTLSNPHSHSGINQQALLAARQMKFTPPAHGGQASVQVSIHFTVAGSDFDRQARERRQQQERARQAELDKQRQEQQAQLERERQERQRQLEQERRERERQLQLEQESQRTTESQVTTPLESPTSESQESSN